MTNESISKPVRQAGRSPERQPPGRQSMGCRPVNGLYIQPGNQAGIHQDSHVHLANQAATGRPDSQSIRQIASKSTSQVKSNEYIIICGQSSGPAKRASQRNCFRNQQMVAISASKSDSEESRFPWWPLEVGLVLPQFPNPLQTSAFCSRQNPFKKSGYLEEIKLHRPPERRIAREAKQGRGGSNCMNQRSRRKMRNRIGEVNGQIRV